MTSAFTTTFPGPCSAVYLAEPSTNWPVKVQRSAELTVTMNDPVAVVELSARSRAVTEKGCDPAPNDQAGPSTSGVVHGSDTRPEPPALSVAVQVMCTVASSP